MHPSVLLVVHVTSFNHVHFTISVTAICCRLHSGWLVEFYYPFLSAAPNKTVECWCSTSRPAEALLDLVAEDRLLH